MQVSLMATVVSVAYKIHIRGTEAVPIKALRKLCTERGKQQIDVAGVPMPTAIENLHLLIGGATGSGKTVLLRGTLLSALKRGDRNVIVDPNGTFYSTFGQAGARRWELGRHIERRNLSVEVHDGIGVSR